MKNVLCYTISMGRHAEESIAGKPQGDCAMIDYNELDAMLAQEEEKYTAEEEKKRLEKEQLELEGLSEEELEYIEDRTEFDRSRAEKVRSRIELYLEAARKDYDHIPTEIRNARQDMLGYIFAWLFHTAGYPFLYMKMSNLYNAIPLVILGFFWIFYTGKFGLKVLNVMTNYRVLTGKKRVSQYVEEARILTFEKKREHALQKIHAAKERLTALEVFERKIEARRGLSEAEIEEMNALARIPEITTPYREYKTTFRDYISFLVNGSAE